MSTVEFAATVLGLLLSIPQNGTPVLAGQTASYDRTKVVHRFTLFADGGAIELVAKDPTDVETRKALRAHALRMGPWVVSGNLTALRAEFGDGVPGLEAIATARARKATITVRSGGTDDGGFVDFTSADAANREAIHDFLRFLINDLNTGDSTEIKERAAR